MLTWITPEFSSGGIWIVSRWLRSTQHDNELARAGLAST
jgi:hypothetical protein